MIRFLVAIACVTLWACTVTRPPDPCIDVACGAGRCVVDQGAAACLCDEGFRADGLSCMKSIVDVCDSISCGSIIGSRCVTQGPRASCQCPGSEFAHEGSCVAPNPCLPNPCTRVRRTTCEVINGGASCRCDLGYAPEGDGCSAIPLWTCNTQHSGANEDEAEPDECPPLASMLAPMTDAARNLAPLGDHDWFRITPYLREITWFEATSADVNTALVIELFDTDGTQLLASDNRGLTNAGVGFVSSDGSSVLARVRALGASAAGGYTASYRSLGFDDFADREVDAASLAPGSRITGSTQFPGDVDMLWLEVPAQLAVQLRFDSSTALLEVKRDGVTMRTLRDGDGISITSPVFDRLLLVAKSEAGALGAFTVHTQAAGPDDHATDPAFATPMSTDGTWFVGSTEQVSDIDSLTVPQMRGRTYVAKWNSLSGTTVPTLAISEANGAFIARSSAGRTELAWKAVGNTRAVLSVTNSTTGNWQLSVSDLGPDDHADDSIGATPVSLQMPISGVVTLDADVDAFVITPSIGHILRATVTTPIVSTALNVAVSLPSGEVISGGRASSMLVTHSGPHLVYVRAPSATVTPYTLVVTDEGVDDHGATPTPLPLDAWGEGETQFIDDVDTFSFAVTAGTVYRVTYEHVSFTRTAALRCNGTLVLNSINVAALFAATTNGTCEVQVSSAVLGDFRVRVESLGADDHPNTPTGASAVSASTPALGAFEYPNDRDVFRLNAAAQRAYRVSVAPMQGELRLLAADGTVLHVVYGSQFDFAREQTEAVFISVVHRGAVLGNYTLTVTELGLDDHRSSIAGATPLALGVVVNASTDYLEDIDTFVVAAPPQRHLRARCIADTSACFVGLRHADGGLAIEGTTNALTFRATPGEPNVWLDVATTLPTPYTLEVTDVGADDVGDTRSTGTLLSLGAAGLERTLEVPGDVDLFRIAVTEGEIVAAHCTALTSSQCFVRMVSPLGVEVSPNFRASTAGEYALEISGAPGTYRVTATLRTDDHGNTGATATPLTAGQPIAGVIDYATDVDFFSIAIGAGQRLNLELSTQCRLRVVTPMGATGLSTFADSSSYFTNSAGTYFVAVSDCDGAYTLLSYF